MKEKPKIKKGARPDKIVLEPDIRKLPDSMHPFKSMVNGALEPEEREVWIRTPEISDFRCYSAGIYLEAHKHRWERSAPGLPEGVLIYCADGKGYYEQAGRRWTVAPGDLLYCPPSTGHKYWADKKTPWSIFWMHLCGKRQWSYEEILGLLRDGPVLHVGMIPDIDADFRRLTDLFRPDYDRRKFFLIQAQAIYILGRLFSMPKGMSTMPAQAQAMHKVSLHMEERLNQRFNLEYYAHHSGYSTRHFIRTFKQVMGMAPCEYFNRLCIRRAASMLAMSDMRISEVAAALGFQDPFYFSRLFKRIMKISPEKYRLRSRQHQ